MSSLQETTNQTLPLCLKNLLSNTCGAAHCSIKKDVPVLQLRFLPLNHVGSWRLTPPSPRDPEQICHSPSEHALSAAFITPRLGLSSAFLSGHTCLGHSSRLHLYSSNSCQPPMAGSQASTRSMVSELDARLPYGPSCSSVSRRLSWAEAGSSYGNIFLRVRWFCQTSCFNYSSLLMNK